jgi:hypothetical protein
VAQVLLGDGDVDLHELPPFRGSCPRCSAEIVVVELGGEDVALEVREVLEVFACPQCSQVSQKGHTRVRCWRCSDTGWVGVPLPPRGVAISEAGGVRAFDGWRLEGEAVYVPHRCG